MPRQTDHSNRHRPRSAGAAAIVLAPILSIALVACDAGGSGSGPGGVSEGEAEALDEAAEMLDEQQLPNDAMPETDLPAVEQAPSGEAEEEAPAEEDSEGSE